MARPKSKDKRDALMAAATRVIVAQGLGAPTAVIAREAGISNGSLFTYFKTKADLYNQLYLELKTGMATASLTGLPAEAPLREQFARMWSNWMDWAMSDPDKRRALALLDVSDDISPPTRTASHEAMAEIADMLERARARGPMREAPMGFVVAMANSVAETTMDFMVNDPAHADEHCRAGFDALGRLLGS
ncbi:MAG TPA: TetR/AcrR family transcriptional regulator [Streptosporangiaceae bacterium]|jgi:AcrR family transcriptional regulator|nr:TetR/AcrR family transcriptional regulator [Streptosporangiaceae bacterium]